MAADVPHIGEAGGFIHGDGDAELGDVELMDHAPLSAEPAHLFTAASRGRSIRVRPQAGADAAGGLLDVHRAGIDGDTDVREDLGFDGVDAVAVAFEPDGHDDLAAGDIESAMGLDEAHVGGVGHALDARSDVDIVEAQGGRGGDGHRRGIRRKVSGHLLSDEVFGMGGDRQAQAGMVPSPRRGGGTGRRRKRGRRLNRETADNPW